ncbi:MAG: type II toxin-antitoxin system death-on-curing family toxin [Syntrophales bacterium]|nr:type II toxin-antitoxin system death-on-curing family toxin [Syntrophales bacterium]MDD5641545.1 type II toxin-antitoxin system death-on-curing family toxin [Syntrophales bacterium]
MIYLTKEEIISINKDMISSFGGIYYEGICNVKNDNSFQYLINAPAMEAFGVQRYPNIFNKAASYLFFIIKDHIFCDGNKRTGMMAAFTFLDINGVEISAKLNIRRIVNYAERIAGCKPNISNISSWLRNISKI